MFPDELKGLTPVEEKLISLNSCYGGHITVFPNNVQELAQSAPAPLCKHCLGDSIHGVPSSVCDRMERNEPSGWEKARTAHVVPPTERAVDEEGPVEIEELFALLNQGQEAGGQGEGHGPNGEGAVRDGSDACPDQNVPAINEVTSSGMFALDGPPDVADVEKLQFACDAVGEGADDGRAGRERGSGP
ncbi:hypothetical protein HRG_007290 [Hirsutella rhossiliensis]